MQRLQLTLLAFGLGFACAVEPPPSAGDASLYELAGVKYACSRWSPAEPAGDFGLFDIFWGNGVAGVQLEGPTERHREALADAGGILVREFYLPMVRAIVRPERVPQLSANITTGVPDAGEYQVEVHVGYASRARDVVVAFIESLDGDVTHVFDITPALVATLSNDVIPELRAHPDVAYVEGSGVGCLTGP